jgi:arylsulfatase A-like enzyme
MMLLLWISRIPPSMDVKVKPDVTAVPPSEARPHIYLVVLDTMRRDVFAPYTADAGRQPVLARFATEGIVFEDAWTPVPYTSGSHASMIFGVYPAHHRVGLDVPGLPANLSSLPLFLRKNGYATGAVSANPHISRFFGYSRHFEFVGEPEKSLDLRPSKKEHTLFNKKLLWIAFRLTARVGMLDPVCRLFNVRQTKIDGSSVVDMATRFVRENRESPIFLLVNFMETHWPYSPSSGQKNNLFPGPGSTWRDLLVKYPKVLRDQQKETAATQAARFTEEEAAILRSLYLERSEYLDVHLGNFFHGLEEMGALDKALVIIVADHGELMGENGLFGHACDLDERLLHVPMILWWSEGLMPDSLRGKRFWPRVSLVDIPHTLVEILAGTEPSMEGWIPSGAFTGRSFREDLSEPDFLLGNAQDGVLPAMIPPDVPFPRGWEKVSQSTPSRDTVPVFSSLGDRVRVIYGNRSAIFEKGQFMGGARSTEKGWEEDEIPPPDEIVRLADLYQEMLRNRGVGAESEDLPEYMKEHLRALGYIQ